MSNIADLINIQNNLEKQISNIDNSDEELDKLKSEEARLLKECEAIASELTEIRTKASKVIEQEMRNRLIPLGIPNVRFSIKIENKISVRMATTGYHSYSVPIPAHLYNL